MMSKIRKTNSESCLFDMKPKPLPDRLFKSTSPDEAIVVNLADGHYYTLNEVGQTIWQAMNGKRSILAIAGKIANRYRIGKEKAVREVSQYIAGLSRRDLVKLKKPAGQRRNISAR